MIAVEEMAEIKRQLAGLQAVLASLEARVADDAVPLPRDFERALAGARRTLLPRAYISNIAWDVLLDLDAAQRTGELLLYPVETPDSSPSAETQMRYLGALEADDMISLSPDSDGRYSAALTPKGSARLDQIFATALAASATPMVA